MPEVLDRLHSEHADLSRLLDLLDRELARFGAGEGGDYDTIASILRYCTEYSDAVHHPKEDMIYGILLTRDPALAAAVGDLEEDHRRLAMATRNLAELIKSARADQPVDRDRVHQLSREFLQEYRTHIAREESQMFPAARRALSEQDWAELDSKLRDPDDPLFGDNVADYFRGLRQDIDRLAEMATGGGTAAE